MNRLKDLRKNAGLTLAELAKRTGYGVSTINNLENGRTTASDALLKKLATALGTTPADLVAPAAAPKAHVPPEFRDRTAAQAAQLDTLPAVIATDSPFPPAEELERLIADNMEQLRRARAEDVKGLTRQLAEYMACLITSQRRAAGATPGNGKTGHQRRGTDH